MLVAMTAQRAAGHHDLLATKVYTQVLSSADLPNRTCKPASRCRDIATGKEEPRQPQAGQGVEIHSSADILVRHP
jgi:hypothetical protein